MDIWVISTINSYEYDCYRHLFTGFLLTYIFISLEYILYLEVELLGHMVTLGLPDGSAGKESTCNVGDLGLIPGLGRSVGEGKTTHSSILAWRIPWTVESMGSQRVWHNWAIFTFTSFMVTLCLIFWGTARLFSKTFAPVFIPRSSVSGFKFFWILTNTCLNMTFWF